MPDSKAVRSTAQDHTAFAQMVKDSLRSVKLKVASIRQMDSRLFVASVISPAAATLIAALATAIGGNQLFAQAAAQVEDGGWKIACFLAAIFGFIATVSTMFKKQFDDRLAQGDQCVGRLLVLDSDITTQSRTWEEAAKEYGEIVKTYPEFVS